MIFLSISALLSHWRKKPFQMVFMLLSLSVASALWSGVAIINEQARNSYNKAGEIFEQSQTPLIISSTDTFLPDNLFAKFRRIGVLVSPIISGKVDLKGEEIEIIGIEAVTHRSPYFEADLNGDNLISFILPPYEVFMNQETNEKLKDQALFSNTKINNDLRSNLIIMDIGLAQNILDKSGFISRLELYSPDHEIDPRYLSENNLVVITSDSGSDFKQLTRSFHLNLAAFGFLSFLVGLFIFYSAINLAIEQRRKLISLLSSIGVSKLLINFSLIIELLIIASIGSIIGMILGYSLSIFLLPDVSGTLKGLFGVPMDNNLTLPIRLWIVNLAFVVIGVFFASLSYLVRINKTHNLYSTKFSYSDAQWMYISKALSLLGLMIILCGTIIFFNMPQTLTPSFIYMGAMLVGFTLFLPYLLTSFLSLVSFFSKSIEKRWFISETLSQSKLLNVALMAIMLSFSINIGVSGMVNSFRYTFTSWLDKRLASEVYLQIPDPEYTSEILNFSELHASAILPIYGANFRIESQSASVFAFKPHATYRDYWPLIECLNECWDDIESDNGWLINEQFARKLNLKLGDELSIELPQISAIKKVVGIYSDYGNPRIQIMIPIDSFIANYPKLIPRTYALRLSEDKVKSFIKEAKELFPFDSSWITDQQSVKSASLNIFERTFTITNTLSILTLIIAGLSIFSTLIVISESRRGQLVPAWAMGVSSKRLAFHEFLRSIILCVLSIIFAIPLGVFITYILTKYINVSAFGWELPSKLYPYDWLKLAVSTTLIISICVSVPLLRNNSSSTRSLLRVFHGE